MTSLTTYDVDDGVATITMDDGKVNALSVEMLSAVSAGLDRAETEGAVVVLSGRERTFSAGFDLRTPPEGWREMLIAGARLAERILSFPRPVVAACDGNAIAMGAFLLLAADHRIGAEGEFKIGLNEVAIGMTLPHFGIALAEHRLTRPYFDRCAITGVTLTPGRALQAGFLDELTPAGGPKAAAIATAQALAGINMEAHLATKLRVRAEVLAGVRHGITVIESQDSGW
jgi:enoyl-CoA hydratase